MKLILADFKVGVATHVQAQYDAKDLDIEFVDLNYTAPLFLDATVEKGADTVTFLGALTSRIVHTCGRCLKKIEEDIRRPFDLYYEISNQEVIDTLNDLREVLILDHTLAYVCSEECKGLCPHCGKNLNESTCQCSESKSAGSFDSLKQWKTRKEEKKHGKS